MIQIVFRNVSGKEDWKTLAICLKSTVRKHDLGHNVDKQGLYIIVLNTTPRELTNATERFRKVLEDYGYEIRIKYVIFPDDGEDLARLFAGLE